MQVLKSVVGQSAFQLAVMYALVCHGPAIFGVGSAALAGGAPSEHYTLVFNAFVLMQLFNQARAAWALRRRRMRPALRARSLARAACQPAVLASPWLPSGAACMVGCRCSCPRAALQAVAHAVTPDGCGRVSEMAAVLHHQILTVGRL